MTDKDDDFTEATGPASEEIRYVAGTEKDAQDQQERLSVLQAKGEDLGNQLGKPSAVDTDDVQSRPLYKGTDSNASAYTASDDDGDKRTRRHQPWDTSVYGRTFVLVFFLLGMIIVTFILPYMFRDKLRETERDTNNSPLDLKRMEEIKTVIVENRISSLEHLEDETSDAYYALQWLTQTDPAQLVPVLPGHTRDAMEERDGEMMDITNTELLQRYAMAVLYYATHSSVDPEAHSLGKVVEVSESDHNTLTESNTKEETSKEETAPQERLAPVVVSVTRDEHETQRRETESAPPPGWFRDDSWMTSKSICEWYGIECQDSTPKQVVHLNLTANSLRGTMPSELQALTHLVLMDISHNELSGEVPEKLMNHLPLNYFMVNHNHLIGSIPYTLAQLKEIQELDMSYNRMKGNIPTSIGSLSQLRLLNLENNQLDGGIPALGALTELHTLKLGSNHLEGTFPFDITLLKKIVELGLGDNTLTGTFPPELDSMHYLRSLDLSENDFEGEIPDIFSRLVELQDLKLARNKFSSELPGTIGFLTNLKNLLLSSNELVGPIPNEWASLTLLERLELDHNVISGTIPMHVLRGMPELHCLRLSYNSMEDTIPSHLATMTSLRNVTLESNKFYGTIPLELGEIKSLEVLQLDHNELSGTMPNEICELKTNGQLTSLSSDCGKVQCDCCDNCFKLFG